MDHSHMDHGHMDHGDHGGHDMPGMSSKCNMNVRIITFTSLLLSVFLLNMD